jgi:hypothetical protein
VEHSPEHHAEWFLRWLLERNESNVLLYPEMLILYQRMARELNWVARPWNPVGNQLTKLLGGRKTFAWITCADGSRHRLRVYRLPARRDPGAPHSASVVNRADGRKFEESA